MVDVESLNELFETAGFIALYALIVGEGITYGTKGCLYPYIKSELEEKVEDSKIRKEEADYRLRTYRICMLIPAPVDKVYAMLRRCKYEKERFKGYPR